MANPVTPVTPTNPLPDPKVRKRCKHKECTKNAIFLEDYCWEHLPDKAKSKYKEKIEEWVKQGRSLEGANLYRINLQGANLRRANLQKANLNYTNLHKANLWEVNLREANLFLVNLQKATLNDADLQKANLLLANLQGANLHYADLQETLLFGASLQEALLLDTNLQEANLSSVNLREACLSNAKLRGASLHGVLLDGTLELTWEQIKRVGEEKAKKWKNAQDAYLRLKNYFHQQGRYEDESKAYYREKLMAKHEAYDQCFKKKHPKHFFNWFGLWLLWAVAGFGERWMRIIPWGAGILLFFTGLFFLGSNLGWGAPYDHPTLLSIGNLFDCFVFSVVTFVTLGFGDIWPDAWIAKILVGAEVVLGYVFLGMIVVLIARKFGR